MRKSYILLGLATLTILDCYWLRYAANSGTKESWAVALLIYAVSIVLSWKLGRSFETE